MLTGTLENKYSFLFFAHKNRKKSSSIMQEGLSGNYLAKENKFRHIFSWEKETINL